MGIMKHIMQGSLDVGAKSLMGAADAATGGLASKLTNTMIHGVHNNAGVIGKVASGIGKSMLNDKFRGKLAGIADKALDYIPAGTVKTALTKINDEAQGRKGTYAPSNSSPSPLMKPTTGNSWSTFHASNRAARMHNWNNPSHVSNSGGMGNA